MVNCAYDLSGKYLAYVTGETMKSIITKYNSKGQLYQFDQEKFNCDDSLMFNHGFMYIPDACKESDCKLHVFFHGCEQTAGTLGASVMQRTGLLEHAAANNIVTVFPQNWDPGNQNQPQHCWSAGASDDVNHPQIMALRRILKTMYNKEMLTDKQPLTNCDGTIFGAVKAKKETSGGGGASSSEEEGASSLIQKMKGSLFVILIVSYSLLTMF